ncbi:hypothetical protein [Sphingomonas quercus]|uniref:VOC domain-containing protein n=1 Tax=Sphingomonas quercus TaxID=2842451 RepID=A0ABS6BDY5_9SPHN|nr:hypothetical protein [Sphingomonas quercus]MBU3076523.1 hypothetical protein [Sphingomonas quercus]
MLFHVSIEADRPQHVASVIAELWDGKALPFPPVGLGSWVAFAGDDRSTLIEVYPRGTELHEAPGDHDAVGVTAAHRRYTATHMAIATPLDVDRVFAIARREDWPCKVCTRGGKFRVIELWVEGGQLVEVLTAEMQREYLATVTIENWERMLAAAPRMAA